MKATEDLVIAVNKDNVRVPFRVGVKYKDLKFTTVKKGTEIPEEHLRDLLQHNIEFVDVEYEFRVPINIPKGFEPTTPPVSKELKIKKRKYTQSSLNAIYNDKGFGALKKVGEEFGVTDRSSRRIIVEILRAQEETQRAGL